MRESEFAPQESALTALARMTVDEFAELVAEKISAAAGAQADTNFRAKPCLTIEDLTQMLQLGKKKIDSLIQEGKLPPPLFGGGSGSRRIWSYEQFKELLEAS